MRANDLLDPAARQRLEDVIFEVERTTSGELILDVVTACDEYGSIGWRVAALFAAIAFLGLAGLAPPDHAWVYLVAQAIAVLVAHGLARIDAVRRWLLPHELVETRVAERARRAFGENGLTRTAGRTGILVFVAVLERRVVVLADEGIHRVLDPDERWEDVVALAVAGLREGRAVEGLEAALRRCGAILARHAPAPDHNPNELPNRVVVED
jgi:putative membrane protein